MIIEKKDLRPNIDQITVPFNYVLVQMEAKYTTYQMSGRELGIEAAPYVYDEQQNVVPIDERLVSPFGKIVKCPLHLVFNGKQIKKLADRHRPIRYTGEVDDEGDRLKTIVDYSALKNITELKTNSLDVDTDLEVNVGDRIYVSYLHFLNAERDGLFIDTQQGQIVMIKYDLLRMVVDEKNQPKKMLNGWVLIEPKKYDVGTKEEDGREFEQLPSGLVLLNPVNTKKTRKTQLGNVVMSARPLRGYLEDPTKTDDHTFYSGGEKILYDPRYSIKLENDLHQIISEKDLYLIRREGIVIDENTIPKGFDFDKIEI